MIQAAVRIFFDILSFLLSFAFGLLMLSFYGSYGFHEEKWIPWWNQVGLPHSILFLVFVAGIILRFFSAGLYHRNLTFWDETIKIWQTTFTFALVHGFVTFIAKWPIAKSVFLVSWGSAMILLPLIRAQTRKWFVQAKITLISQPDFRDSAQQIAENLGYCPDLFLELKEPTMASLNETLKRGNNFLILADDQSFRLAQDWAEKLSLSFKNVHLVPPLSGLPLVGAEIQPLMKQEALVLTLRHQMRLPVSRFLKRSLDIAGALIGLVLLAPFFVIVSLWIRRTPGPIFFAQRRVGRDGNSFPCYKFRTMIVNAEEVLKNLLEKNPELRAEWQRDFKLKNDPRITPVGHFLRKTSLDEIPQLWNILKGEMSLVGPRPVTEAEMSMYGNSAQLYRAVRPGLTGLWQISGRNDTTYQERVSLDSWYVKNWSIWYDLVIILETINVVFKRKGAY